MSLAAVQRPIRARLGAYVAELKALDPFFFCGFDDESLPHRFESVFGVPAALARTDQVHADNIGFDVRSVNQRLEAIGDFVVRLPAGFVGGNAQIATLDIGTLDFQDVG